MEQPKLTLAKQAETIENIGAPRAEIISELWQAIGFLEECRTKLPRVRQSPSREAAAVAITAGMQQLMLAAAILSPKVPKPEALDPAREGRP